MKCFQCKGADGKCGNSTDTGESTACGGTCTMKYLGKSYEFSTLFTSNLNNEWYFYNLETTEEAKTTTKEYFRTCEDNSFEAPATGCLEMSNNDEKKKVRSAFLVFLKV